MNNMMNMKNNLIQNFYIVGLSLEDLSKNIKKEKNIFTSTTEQELSPKIISKFPPYNYNHNSIPNEIIISHCFPNGLKMEKCQKKDLNIYSHFCFEIDNLKYAYLSKNKFLYSKIYFTCLKFNESIQDYQKIKIELEKNNNIKNETEVNNNIINSNYISNNINNNDNIVFYIPKVICFASLLPFTKELIKILNNLYDYLLYYNTNINNNISSVLNNLSPIEKILEQLVMSIPFPISEKMEYCLSYKFNFPINSITSNSTVNTSNSSINNLKNNLILPSNNNQIGVNNFPYNNTNIIFPIYDPLICFMNDLYSGSLNQIFIYFNEEEVVKIFKYIILEIPILFFCENIEILSQIVQGFISLLQPFNYVLPHVTVLPSKFYGLINMETTFIFGIAENYSIDFFKSNNILLDKSVIVINIIKGKKGKIEEVKKIDDQKDYVIIDNYNIYNYINNESILPNGTKVDVINIDFPNKCKKKLISTIKAYLNESRKKKDNNFSGEYGHIFNQKIRSLFYRFLTNVLSGYSDYLLKINTYNLDSKDNIGFYSGDNIRYKINYNNNNLNMNSNNNYNNEILFIKSVFNMDEFISKFPKDNHMFYRIFCNTKLFQNFIREIIFCNDEQILLNHKYFNLITFFKKHKELKKQNKYKEFLLKYKNLLSKKNDKNDKKEKEEKTEPKILNISTDISFNLDEKSVINNKDKQNIALNNYGQLITIINGPNNTNPININNNVLNQGIFMKYLIFPKMLFDNEFFGESYDRLFFRHYLELPNNLEIKNLYDILKVLNKHYLNKYKEILLPKGQNEVSGSTKEIIEIRRSISSNYNNMNINSNQNLEVLVDNYIEYNWLLLISCSLWYCFNPLETEIRINKIFDVLEKIDFIEEQVLFFLYIAIYNFGNKSQFIKMFEFLNRFMGYASYTNLIYLCLKLNQKESGNNKDMKEKIEFKKRSFSNINEVKSNINIDENNNKENKINESDNINNSNQKEEIDFYTIQICPKCKKENQINNFSDINHHRISQKRDILLYNCTQCGEENINIKIKYILSLNSKKKNESITISEGYFKLIPPHKIYQQLKEKFIYLKDNKLDIDHIFSNDDIYLLNNIYYFTDRLLPFDFLIPYEGQEDREYFEEEYEEEEEKQNNNIINNDKNKIYKNYSINSNNFSLVDKE